MALLSANCIICERAIREKDDVISAFRIVDIFFAKVHPSFPLEQQQIPVTILAILKFTDDDAAPHSVSLALKGPEREPKSIDAMSNQVIQAGRIPNAPKVIVVHGQIGVTPKLGSYDATVLLDGREVAKNQFIVAEPPDEQLPRPQGSSDDFPTRPQ